MDLNSYIKGGRGRAAAIAAALGVSPVMVSQWASRLKPIPVLRCVAIESITSGAVRRWDMRPADWHLIWLELMADPAAPAVSGSSAADALSVVTTGSSVEPAAAEVQTSRAAA